MGGWLSGTLRRTRLVPGHAVGVDFGNRSVTAARNVAASLGRGTRKPYRHRDLGFVVDLGGWQAVANPLHIPLSGPLAKIVTRAYHLYALPGNRLRIATDWLNDIIEHRQFVQLGLIPDEDSSLEAAEHTGIYYQTDGQPLDRHRQGTSTCARHRAVRRPGAGLRPSSPD